MKTYDNIPEELNSLACIQLRSISNKVLPYTVPSSYFSKLTVQILAGVKASLTDDTFFNATTENAYSLPPNYFEDFSSKMLVLAKQADHNIQHKTLASVAMPFTIPANYFDHNTDAISALINGELSVLDEWNYLTGNMPYQTSTLYEVPINYFENLRFEIEDKVYSTAYPEPDLNNSILGSLKTKNPFEAPAIYFDLASNQSLAQQNTEELSTTVVPFQPKKKNKFAITTVAAAVLLMLSITIFKFALPSIQPDNVQISKEIASLSTSISDQSIEDYIAIYNEEFAYTAFFNNENSPINDYAEILNSIPADEINAYLEILN